MRQVKVQLGWFPLRIPEWPQPLWALVAHQPEEERDLVLLTQVPITTAEARLVSDQWRHRPSIEHTYRFRAAKSAWMSKTPCDGSLCSCCSLPPPIDHR